VDPVPDLLLLRKSVSAENGTRDLWICSQELWPLDHRGGPLPSCITQIILVSEVSFPAFSWSTVYKVFLPAQMQCTTQWFSAPQCNDIYDEDWGKFFVTDPTDQVPPDHSSEDGKRSSLRNAVFLEYRMTDKPQSLVTPNVTPLSKLFWMTHAQYFGALKPYQ
jgi:hypothetical protein